jgi:D-alanyl-lipoteichoic acid acyltransferase DltB (MBOAT superfamily)
VSDLIFSQAAAIAFIYFVLAVFTARLIPVGMIRSSLFALINVAAVWLIFFGLTASGSKMMALYLAIIVAFWLLLFIFKRTPGYLFLVGFAPPIVLLVFSKTTGLLPLVGMSYMMFRCAHLEWELKQRKIEMMSLPDYLCHCFFMPTMLVGPISPYSFFQNSFNTKMVITRDYALNCVLRMVKGAVKLIVIAGIFLQLSPENYLLDYRQHQVYEIVIAALGFYVYMYANFSGLNDISIGAAGLMGIAVKENFDEPYKSQSITEMWARWHITLSQWMRDIVFLPLSTFLMRRARWLSKYQSTAIALMTVFVLIGWWHGNGVGWQYWMMGFLYATAVVAEFYLGQWAKRLPEGKGIRLPPVITRVAKMAYANLYFAMVASLMAVNWQAKGITFVDVLGKVGSVLAR